MGGIFNLNKKMYFSEKLHLTTATRPTKLLVVCFILGQKALFPFFAFIGSHLSSWIQTDLFRSFLQEDLHKKCGIPENPVSLGGAHTLV